MKSAYVPALFFIDVVRCRSVLATSPSESFNKYYYSEIYSEKYE